MMGHTRTPHIGAVQRAGRTPAARAIAAATTLAACVVPPARAWAANEASRSSEATQSADSGKLGEAKISRNPLANSILIPFMFNVNGGFGPHHDKAQPALSIQPLVPVRVNEDWNLLVRGIVPLAHMPRVAPGVGPATGLGDVSLFLWASPVAHGSWVWGIGPAVAFPTATDRLLGTGKYTVGPSGVVAYVEDPWVAWAIVNQNWSVGGDSGRRSVRPLTIQTQVNYGLGNRWYLTTGPIFTADWDAPASNRWTVPLGGGFGKVVTFGRVPVDLTLQAFDNVVRPKAGADWQIRFTVNVILPKK